MWFEEYCFGTQCKNALVYTLKKKTSVNQRALMLSTNSSKTT